MAQALRGERARIARHVHDGLLQHIFALRMLNARLQEMPLSADAADLVDHVLVLLEAMNRDARLAVTSLGAGELPAGMTGLEAVARLQVERLRILFGVDASAEVTDEPALTVGALTELSGVIQESCNNIGRHAQPLVAGIRGYRLGWRYVVVIYDDGVGFERPQAPEGFGTGSMRQRCQSISARLAIKSRPGLGTVVRISIPLADRP